MRGEIPFMIVTQLAKSEKMEEIVKFDKIESLGYRDAWTTASKPQ